MIAMRAPSLYTGLAGVAFAKARRRKRRRATLGGMFVLLMSASQIEPDRGIVCRYAFFQFCPRQSRISREKET